jgi:DNA-binding response OmpR family regulator
VEHPALRGRSILLVTNQLRIATDIMRALAVAGATATLTTSEFHAFLLVEFNGLSAAIIMDGALKDRDSDELRAQLRAGRIPYLIYSGSELAGVEGLMADLNQLLAGRK